MTLKIDGRDISAQVKPGADKHPNCIRTVFLYFLLAGAFLFSACSPKPFRLVLLPDTQTYTRLYPEIFESQTKWIASQADSIDFVLQQGDITDNNVDSQWAVAVTSMSMLDGKVPYTVAPGNHDIGKNSDVRNTDLFNKYFPFAKYSAMEGFGGVFKTGEMDNSWHTFKAGGLSWLILSLEFAPRNSVLSWAGRIIEDHPRHKIIINTHAYMYSDDSRMAPPDKWTPVAYGIWKDTGDNTPNDGEQIWDKLAGKYRNVMFVFSGHVLNDGTGKLVSTGVHGNKVYQLLANYQQGVIGAVKGGNGFLRIVSLDPKGKTIDVKSYSPYLKQYKVEDDQQFTFEGVSFR
ncbi:metallophosphoesterase [Daejeonella sp.]|uniref:metallophosphoesterase n=1 Tax=Daejeonella sp. TaxID=2805397 RepID=UPI0030BBD690